ncbi:MAG: Catabolite control protein A [Lentisphaerae bacterium ADurb.Bin242]|nr:MAG: Catabolite control protein A [Lentisphaerae bacterium ADurb.Bin242]
MAANIKDIAKMVGVSRQAAASVLNSSPVCHVSREKRDKILCLARELHYQPNEAAKILKGKPGRLIGVIMDSYANTPVVEIFARLEEYLAQEGYRLQVGLTHENKERFLAHLEDFQRFKAAGIVALAHTYAGPDFNLYEELARYPNTVLFGHPSSPVRAFPRVELDWAGVYSSLATRLAASGARRIALQVTWPGYSAEIMEGYRQGLRLAGLPFRKELLMDVRELKSLSAAEYARRLIALRTDALLTTDSYGVRLISEFTRLGVRIPDEIQIIGRYNLAFGTYVYPGITTLDCCTDDVARRLGRKILSLIASEPVAECDTVTPKLIQRESSKSL